MLCSRLQPCRIGNRWRPTRSVVAALGRLFWFYPSVFKAVRSNTSSFSYNWIGRLSAPLKTTYITVDIMTSAAEQRSTCWTFVVQSQTTRQGLGKHHGLGLNMMLLLYLRNLYVMYVALLHYVNKLYWVPASLCTWTSESVTIPVVALCIKSPHFLLLCSVGPH